MIKVNGPGFNQTRGAEIRNVLISPVNLSKNLQDFFTVTFIQFNSKKVFYVSLHWWKGRDCELGAFRRIDKVISIFNHGDISSFIRKCKLSSSSFDLIKLSFYGELRVTDTKTSRQFLEYSRPFLFGDE